LKFHVKKFERLRWTNEEGCQAPLCKFVKITDYPVTARPLLAEDDEEYFEYNDGFGIEKAIPLAGEPPANTVEEGGADMWS
jgi:hypothetical protein